MEVLATVVAAPHKSASQEVRSVLTPDKSVTTNEVQPIAPSERPGKRRRSESIAVDLRDEDDALAKAAAAAGDESARRSTEQAKVESEGAAIPTYEVIVAARQGNILATAFHPELTPDLRWHRSVLRHMKYSTFPCTFIHTIHRSERYYAF